jgi:hypothetical protein
MNCNPFSCTVKDACWIVTHYRFALYVGVTLIVCTVVASIALFIACPWDTNDWAEGDEYRLPLCNEHTWATSQGITHFYSIINLSIE